MFADCPVCVCLLCLVLNGWFACCLHGMVGQTYLQLLQKLVSPLPTLVYSRLALTCLLLPDPKEVVVIKVCTCCMSLMQLA